MRANTQETRKHVNSALGLRDVIPRSSAEVMGQRKSRRQRLAAFSLSSQHSSTLSSSLLGVCLLDKIVFEESVLTLNLKFTIGVEGSHFDQIKVKLSNRA